MDRVVITALCFSVLVALFCTSYAQENCGGFTFENSRQYTTCSILPVLSSSVHWTYHQSNNTVDLAFRKTGTSSSQWVAWALNPSGQRMAGSQCLVAYQSSTGIRAYKSPIGNEGNPQLQEGNLSFQVPTISANLAGDVMTIYATLQLTSSLLSTNQIWQEGPLSGDSPSAHPMSSENVASMGTIDFTTGQTTASSGGNFNSRQRKRNTHGVLNAVSWGILMPMGAMMARYLKVFKSANPAWFYLHIACQCSAYIVGVAGWATGIKLGNENPITISEIHRNVGIALFALGTLQVFALLLRPKPDHKYRFYWNIYHHATGYAVIGLSIFNVLEGLSILDPVNDWWWAYVGTLIGLGSLAAVLEAVTWFIVIKRKKESREKLPHSMNGAHEANGHGGL
ncbi:hypothetical protein JRO89_XSUnG0221900 [Xanthoceras sorbifolium]|uniref:Cytochrome b561 and DOMON domain-containing protein n=1 Tax=Xanthoceras sorbifolium TaxID=99658 RepID=A0ABQ8GWX3_9ROSI|nr:hypothetical protein JRO89_XSUnG0221900 [Xanthoceras sorbifolium]